MVEIHQRCVKTTTGAWSAQGARKPAQTLSSTSDETYAIH